MKIDYFNDNPTRTNCYVIENNNELIIIDPSITYDFVMQHYNKPIKAVLVTHAHFDHITELESYFNKALEFYFHERAHHKLKDSKLNYSFITNRILEFKICCEQVMFVDEADIYNLAGLDVQILYTPGHTDCSVSFVIGEYLFSGDLIFKNSVGRTDLYSANPSDLIKSLNKLISKKINYKIYSGHGPITTLEEEKKTNPYLRGALS